MAAPNLDTLPLELLLHVLYFMMPHEVTALMATSPRLRVACRDAGFWRNLCFDSSKRASVLQRQYDRKRKTARHHHGTTKARRVTIKAAWNPVFENEPVSWYDEYIQRHAPISVSWFELPRHGNSPLPDNADVLEVCGVALYWPDGPRSEGRPSHISESDETGTDGGGSLHGIPTLLAVAPLEDGSVCLWDVNGTVKKRGAIVQKSVPGLLFSGMSGSGYEMALNPPGFVVTECVSVDSQRRLAYFAVQNRLVEVDLKTLSIACIEVFPRPITALSAAHPSAPLTVGTDKGICMHDSRNRLGACSAFKSVDDIADSMYQSHCAPFPGPGPLSILHIQQPGSEEDISHDIYAVGRIPSILHYDRRKFSSVKDSIHSGASLCSLSSLPYPFPLASNYVSWDSEPPRTGLVGRTVVACGEYKTKGSLEMYPVDHGQLNKSMVNRQTSSSAKIFSVANHGKRLVISDGTGLIRWFERDAFTEARQCKLGSDDFVEDAAEDATGTGAGPAAGPRASNPATLPDSGDIARKLLPTQLGSSGHSTGDNYESSFVSNDLLFWTGEKLGLVSFSPKPGFHATDFVEDMKTEEERATELEAKAYRAKMRQLFQSARKFGGDSDSDD